MRVRLWTGLLLGGLLAPCWATDYVDPGGSFAVAVPQGWQVQRGPAGDLGMLTEFQVGNTQPLTILTVTSEAPVAPERLPGVAETLLGILYQLLQEGGQLTGKEVKEVRFADQPAVRAEVSYTSEGTAYQGYGLVVLTGPHALLLFATAPAAQPQLLQQADAVLATLAPGGKAPRAAGAGGGGGGVFTRDRLATAARTMQAKCQHDPNLVLVAGDPPLTVAAVLNFAGLLSELYGVQLTETEFQMTAERFIEFYKKADAQGKQVLAYSAGNLLKSITGGDAAARQQNRQEIGQVMSGRLQAGAEAGIAWAKVLWEAMQRREQVVARTAAKAPAGAAGTDNEMSEADLDAALELLYFMWVACGRDPNVVTPDLVQQVRQLLQQAFPRLPAGLQSLLANAQQVYSRVRGAWMAATPQQQQQYAQEFSAALNELGFTDPRQQGAGFGGGGGENLTGDLVVNTAWNLSQRATGGAWPSSPRGSGPWG